MNRPIALALALACAGCPKKPPPPPAPRLVEVRVTDRTAAGDRPAPVDTAALSTRAAEALRPALPIALGAAPVSGVDYKLRLDVRLEGAEADDQGVLRAFVEARLTRVGGPAGDAPIANQAVAERVYKKADLPDRAAAFRAHLEHAVDDVLKGLAAQAKLHAGGRAELLAGLADPDPELRAEAIRVASDRKEPEAVPKLIELLKSDDAKTRDRALGALVEIGDRRAVKPITEGARFRDLGELTKAIDAVASLGGDEARAYLEFVASGHEDPEVRTLAKEALARLERRAAAP